MRWFLPVWAFCMVLAGHGQHHGPSATPKDRYLFSVRHFGVRDGLPHRRINQIAGDPLGYLWLATPAGVVRWDGYGFVNHNRENGLARDGADVVACDADGLLWVFHEEGGIDILDPLTGRARPLMEHFAGRAPALAEGPITGLASANDGTIVYAQGGRLVRYRSSSDGFQVSAPLCTSVLVPYVVANRGDIWCICALGRRGWYEGELVHLAARSRAGFDEGVVDTRIRGVYNVFTQGHDLQDTLVKGALGLEVLLAQNTARVLPTHQVVARNDAPDLVPQRLALGAGMVRMRLQDELVLANTRFLRMPEGGDPRSAELLFDLAAAHPGARSRVYDALRDRLGNVWVGTEFGLYQVAIGTDRFQRWLHDERPPRGVGVSVRGMAVLGDRLVVNTQNRGVFTLDSRDGGKLYVDTLRDQGLGLLAVDDRTIWLGRADRLERRTLEGVTSTGNLKAPLIDAWSILPLPNERLMLGTGAGIAVIGTAGDLPSGITPSVHPDHPELDRAVVYHLQRDGKGSILACTSAGLYELDEECGVRKRPSEHGVKVGPYNAHPLATDVRHVHEDASGVLWLSTATRGLMRWDRKSGDLRTIGTREGLPPGSVHAAYDDGQGRLWLPTDNGLVRYDPVSGQVIVFTQADGVAHDEFNRIAHTQGPDGRMFFGGLNGITVVDPREMDALHARVSAPFVLDAVHVQPDGMSGPINCTNGVMRGGPVTLRPGDRYFTVSMRLLSFEDPSFIRYAWRIDGIDRDWNIQRAPELRFTALPYGSHRLRVRGIAADGTWSGSELMVPIDVVPPIYLRWWFIAGCTIALAVLVLAFVRYRERRLREVIQVRDRIALDLHDEVGSTLSSIVLFSTAVSKTTQDLPEKAGTMLQRIKENSTRAMESMNDIVWSVDPEHDALAEVVARMRAFGQPLCEARDIDLEIDVPQGLLPVKLGMTARKNLYLIFKESMNNAVKHADCGRIQVTMRQAGDALVLRVADNGRGMVSGAGASNLGGNGLDNMRRRAAEMGGSLNWVSEPGKGTALVLHFPG